jgi:hypothetical protein
MLPDTYSLLYPGRFLKADILQGKKATLTIKNVDIEELIGENNKAAAKVIVSFAERPLELVLPKTNGECLRRMFGNNPHAWIGKRVTLFPSTTKFGRDTVDCIRIWGSPDLDADMPITVPQGRKKALEMVMHRVEAKNGTVSPPKASSAIDPRILTAFGILDFTPVEQAQYLADNAERTTAQMLEDLNARIDAQNVSEQA